MNDSTHCGAAPAARPPTWIASASDGVEHAVSLRALTAGRLAGEYAAQCGELVTPGTRQGRRCALCDHFSRETPAA